MVTGMGQNKTGGGRGTNQYAVKGRAKTSNCTPTAPNVVARLRDQADAMAKGHHGPATLDQAVRWAAHGDDDAIDDAFNPGVGPHRDNFWVAYDIHGPLNNDGRASTALLAAQQRVAAGHAARIVVHNDDTDTTYMPFDTNDEGQLAVVEKPAPGHEPCNRCGAPSSVQNGRTTDDCPRCRTDVAGPDEADLNDDDDINTVELAEARRALSDSPMTRPS